MAESFEGFLDATIGYVERLRSEGVRYLPVDPELMAALSGSAARRVSAPSPAPAEPAAGGVHPPPTPRVPSRPAPPPLQPDLHPMPDATATAAVPSAPEAASSLSPEDRITAMAELRTRVLACQRCPHLVGTRQNVVFGVGDIFSPLMFVGEAPGADEDLQGEPFVGRAGQLLTKIIETMGLSRSTVYIANILKCRPDTPGQSSGNRKPTSEEMRTCLPHLQSQINLIQPRVLVALGATAIEGLFGRAMPITRVRGQWQQYAGIPVMPTYHPAYLLRNQSLAEKRKVWEDMLKVMERLGMAISEKQRGFFLTRS